MKKVNEIVNFLLGKEKRAYAVAGAMLEGAPIEHPLSTHSASDGTSRKPAGIKAIIRCMAAMFVMLFTLGVGNAWGTRYGKVEITAETRLSDGTTVDTQHTGGLVNANVSSNGFDYYLPSGALTNFTDGTTTSPAKSGNTTTVYFAYILFRGYKMNGCDTKVNFNDGYPTKYSSPVKKVGNPLSPLTAWQCKLTPGSNNTSTANAALATAKAVFVPNDKYVTVNFQSIDVEGISYSMKTNTLTSPSNKTAFEINEGDQGINIYELEHLLISYEKPDNYTFNGWWVSTNNGNTKIPIDLATGSDTATFYYRAKQALGGSFTNHMTLTFGADFEAPSGVSVYLVAPDNFTYTAEHKRGDVVVNSYNMNTNSATTEISSVYADDKIRMIRQNPLDRGYKFVSDRYYKQTTSGGEKVYLQGGSDIRTYTSDDFGAGGTYIGLEYTLKNSCSVAYLTSTNGSYSITGEDPDRSDYPTITKGGAAVVTYEGDKIRVLNKPDRGYRFSRYYTTTDGGTTKTTRTPNSQSKLEPYTFGTCSFGAEFEARTGGFSVTYEGSARGTYTASGVDAGGATYGAITIGSPKVTYTDDEITLTVTETKEGYIFQRFYAVVNEQKVTLGEVSITEQTVNIPAGATAVGADFSYNFSFIVDGVGTNDLATALQLAQGKLDTVTTSKTTATIVVAKDATIEAGNYTIPAGVTLLIPYKDNYYESATLERTSSKTVPTGAYRTLTLKDGAHLEVYGTLEVGGLQSSGGGSAIGEQGIGCPSGQYGYLHMNAGSSVTLNNGAMLNAWGYILGDRNGAGEYLCEIDARRGSTVREQFQIMDWKGGGYTAEMFNGNNSNIDDPNSFKVLPVNQYYIQNIEIPVKYRPGAKLSGAGSVAAELIPGAGPTLIQMDNAGIIGAKYADTQDAAIFLMNNEDDSEDTWVRKYYDPTTDQQVYEINNSAYIGCLVLSMGGFSADSREYKLPITNNFKIHLLSGNMEVTQHTEFLAGSELIVNKKSRMTIPEGVNIYLYDKEDWGRYISVRNNNGIVMGSGTTVKWIPAIPEVREAGRPNVRRDAVTDTVKIEDTKFTISGTLDVQGKLFTTSHGASVISNIADAGTVIFSSDAPANNNVYQLKSPSLLPSDNAYQAIPCTSAQLKNDAGNTAYGEYSTTTGTNAGHSFCFVDMNDDEKGEWVDLVDDGCWAHDQNRVYYIKPHAYVPISTGEPEEKPDHTYRDEYAKTDSIYIVTFDNSGNCQWWCVYPVEGHPDLFECRHKDNRTIYYYDNVDGWMEKKFNVTFKNWNDTTLKYIDAENHVQDHYELPYNSHPQWLSDNPTRSRDAHNTYEFDGWYPEITPSTVVTGDVVFMAKYKATPREYLITFKDDSGSEIETKQYSYGDIPEPTTAAPEGKKWNPAIGAVTGNQVYQLVASTSTYTVIYKNWDGTVLKKTENIASGATTPAAPEATKAADQLNSYTFAGWSPTPAATVTADAIYTATFNTVAQTYTIKFYKEDGTTQIGLTQNLAYGAMPNVPNYSKENPAEHTEYTLVWSPLVSAATKDQNYVATFTEQPRQYTVTWKNHDGTTLETNYVNYGATPAYSGVTPTNGDASASFSGWLPAVTAVTGNQEYTAQFTTEVLTISNSNPKVAGVDETVSATTIIITKSGTVDLRASGSNLEAENLILESDGRTASGQLIASNEQVTATNIYFDFKVNAKNHKWYAVAVPWQVDAQTGISVNGKTLELGKDFDIIYYDGARRAAEGKQKCWTYVAAGEALQPGRLYMIALMMDAPTIRFAKSGGNILTTTTSVTAYSGGAAATDQGWNGVANPALFHAFVNPGVTAGQVYNSETNSYDPILMNEAKFVVGQGAFVEVEEDKAITVAYGGAYAAAPRRVRAEEAPLYDVRIAPVEGTYTDRLFVTVDDKKEEDTYVVGKDLAKLGVSKSVAQMWINRYNTELCLNTMTMENGVAEYPLGIYAPKAGEYTITIHNAQFTIQNEVYLTLNGEAIWNLSDAAYTGTFDAGTTNAYGLRISAKSPQIATGIDEAVVDAKGETRKVLIDNQVFIIRGEKVYSVDGQLVK